MSAVRVPLAMALALLCSKAEAETAPAWTVDISTMTTLAYGEAEKPVLSIGCGQGTGEAGEDESRVEVEAAPGAKPGADPVLLVVSHKGGAAKLPLQPVICGGEIACADRPEGDVARYETWQPKKQLALDIAEKGERISIEAPGVKLDLAIDEHAFETFAGACRNW